MYPGKHTNDGIPLIKSGDISDGKINENMKSRISKDVNDNYSRTQLLGGELLVVLVGNPGLSVVVPKHLKGWNVARAVSVLKLKNKENAQFVSYALQSREVRRNLLSYCNTTVQITLNLKELKEVFIPWPSKPERQEIVRTLDSFNTKIELLQAQNKTLETMAQTIFKEWFGKYQIGDVLPEGWRVGKLGDVIDIFDSQRIPLSKPQREAMNGDYRYYGATKVMDYVNDYLFDGIYLLFAEDGSVMDENGHPFLQYVWGKFWVNNHTHILKGKNGFSTELLYVLCKKMKVAGIVNGAVQLKINQGNLLSKEIVLPTDFILYKVDKIIQPLFNKLRINSSQIQSLTKTRDTLLPKLMSGQVRVNNLKQTADA